MKKNSFKKWLSVIGCMVLIAAMALITTGCTENPETPMTTGGTVGKAKVMGDGATVFQFIAVDLEGKQSAFEIHTDEKTVGAALVLAVALPVFGVLFAVIARVLRMGKGDDEIRFLGFF